MIDVEKLGVFYLGRRWDRESRSTTEEPLLYDAKDLTTHGVIVGMTGSGKTGLAAVILEEAAIDSIPALVIDPKGDLTNLLLTFPQLRPSDFEPWVDPAEASRSGQTVSQYAGTVAERWRSGLAEWDQDGERVGRFAGSVERTIYTPGSNAGLPLSVLGSFAAPRQELRQDEDLMRERVASAASGLLALLGIEADPIQSREHILLANVIDRAWRRGDDLDLATLIQQIQSPPFDKLGVLELETFYPEKERRKLALGLNSLLAAPGFEVWREGAPLEIERLLYTDEGRPRLSIVSIAHLSESERMFVVTLLLSELLAWMRTQPGTSSLRALLYMDEIFGFFPPSRQPPSKAPMLTLLKQARAYGLGVLLATQNPVDLDYKGLSNCGTWFVGRLQTERDKQRMLDGLQGASEQARQAFDRATVSATIGGLGKRVFLMSDVHEDAPELFQTRWALSYLRGPLVRSQIETLMADQKAKAREERTARESARAAVTSDAVPSKRPTLPAAIEQLYLFPAEEPDEVVYQPRLLGTAQLHFKRKSAGVDDWQTVEVTAPIPADASELGWAGAEPLPESTRVRKRAVAGARYGPLPDVATRAKAYESAQKKLASWLYREWTLTIWRHAELRETSEPGESEAEFRKRLSLRLREERDRQIEALRVEHAEELAELHKKVESAEKKLERERAQAQDRFAQTAISLGKTLLGALAGRKVLSSRNVSSAGTAARDVSRSAKERVDVDQAQDSLETLVAERDALVEAFEEQLEALRQRLPDTEIELEPIEIRPLKSDISVERVALAWTP